MYFPKRAFRFHLICHPKYRLTEDFFLSCLQRYSIECSERGLKLTSPGCRAKDEGFESDCESIRSVKITEAVELDLTNLLDHLDIAGKHEKETESGAPSSPAGSMDSTSLTSSSGVHHTSDDSNSSSGNGSDSDEFGAFNNDRSPYWETLPNLSSFQSYPIEDVVFCHCDSLHPSTLVWVVRHLEKMIALVTAFRTRSETEELFSTYRDLRVKLKPVKYKINPVLGTKLTCSIPPAPNSPAPSPPSSSSSSSSPASSSSSSDSSDPSTFTSLPHVYPTEILHETHQSKSSALFSYEPKSLGYDFLGSPDEGSNNRGISGSREALSRTGSNSLSLQTHVYETNPNIVRVGHNHTMEMSSKVIIERNNGDSIGSSEDNVDASSGHVVVPSRPLRKVYGSSTIASSSGGKLIASMASSGGGGTLRSSVPASKPVLLVPLKTESVTAPKSTYPKESYLYQVMGRSSSTFAPYQRSLNFMHHHGGGGGDYMAWGNGGQLLVPFSSWLELSEMPNKGPHSGNGTSSSGATSGGRKNVHGVPKGGRISSRNGSRICVGAKGTTSKILLRDAAGRDGMWASLSQRFKKNFRENLIPKLNGMWSQPNENGRKKRPNKKVTFNAWATVQMV
jgi:hypothetical protein